METINQFTCFIASPSDVSEERNMVLQVINEINQTDGVNKSFSLFPRMWENATPDIGEDGQDVLNHQLEPENSDLFIVIMWGKIGTPTKRDESGTVEEFNRALCQYRKTTRPLILSYFSLKDIENISKTSNYVKVDEFKQRCRAEGILYSEYSSIDEFGSKLRKHLRDKVAECLDLSVKAKEDEISKRNKNAIIQGLEREVAESLCLYEGQKVEWIPRRLWPIHQFSEYTFDKCLKNSIGEEELLVQEGLLLVKGAAQSGLSSLAHQLVYKAFVLHEEAWAYVDFEEVYARENKLVRFVEGAKALFCRMPTTIIVDNWSVSQVSHKKIIELIQRLYPDIRIVLMQTDNNIHGLENVEFLGLGEDAKCYCLLDLPKHDARKMVKASSVAIQHDSDIVLEKLLSDIDALNINRSPLNCLTLLKAQEYNFDQRVINRTALLERVLAAIFYNTPLSTYDSEPDIKDCEFILGAFAEHIILNKQVCFSEDFFRKFCIDFANQKKTVLNLPTLWAILTENKLLIRNSEGDYRFRFSFWIYFFAAKRMKTDHEFKEYVLSERHYASYPEIIEYYTGIGRNETEVLARIQADLATDIVSIDKKIGLSGYFNPLDQMRWKSADLNYEGAKKVLNDKIAGSSLPQEIKDSHADMFYNHRRPYHQDIRTFLNAISFQRFLFQLKTLSRALRNSDYAEANIKEASLATIIESWIVLSKVFFVLSPLLTHQHYAVFLDFGVALGEGFKGLFDDPQRLFRAIVQANPENVVMMVKEDLSSGRIGRLFEDYIEKPHSSLSDYLISTFLIACRPEGWHEVLRKIVVRQNKESYLLYNIEAFLKYIYQFSYVNSSDSKQLELLHERVLAKHFLNNNDISHGYKFAQFAQSSLPKPVVENVGDGNDVM